MEVKPYKHGLAPAVAKVRHFHEGTGTPIVETPAIPDEQRKALRISLIEEEVIRELLPAMHEDDLEGIADGIADAIYVLIGAAIEYGIPIGAIFDEVHRANMGKVGGPKRPDGKAMKPEGWKPPRIKEILAAARVEVNE